MGIVSFSPGIHTGVTRFMGSLNVQNIDGVVPMYWCNVDFNNSSTRNLSLVLSGQVNVFGNVNFTRGILDSNASGAKIIFEKGASSFGESDDSHIDGAVFKVGNEEFDFPVGNQNFYRKAGISAPLKSSDSFSVRYYYEEPKNLAALPESIEFIDNREYWVINKDNASSDIILTLSWDDAGTTPASITANPLDIRIVRFDESTNSWVDEAGAVDQVNKTISSPVAIKKYGVFTLGSKKIKSSPSTDLGVVVYNAVTPNGDGVNDYFKIKGLENTQNVVSIFNRWGSEVYKTINYDTIGNVFSGVSQFKGVLSGDGLLPAGTYFYVITYTENGTGKKEKKVGYLYIN
ncbi:gliding motility-associated C-terminal domain-containing protein [Flavobacterium oncorhynchi]|uniref:gliding motility-associated C-terminal domain-containing protein n=1 Tax=Flavobacterium oncorhynchi TaxID=728056 RepID=UPI00351A5029